MITWLLKHWPRCTPYDGKKRICLGEKHWNGRCPKHVVRASAMEEML